MTTEKNIPHSEAQTGYDPTSGTYHTHHDWNHSEPLSYTVLTAVSALTGEDPQAAEPMTNVISPDALNAVFGTRQRGGRPTDHVTITYAGCDVTVHRNGHVVVRPRTETEEGGRRTP